MIDFGLAKRYRDPRTGLHIPYKDMKNLVGTARYASINTHLGIQQSRRDDIECLGYVLVYFLKGKLPWQGLEYTSKSDKHYKIKKKKSETSLKTLCEDLPGINIIIINLYSFRGNPYFPRIPERD